MCNSAAACLCESLDHTAPPQASVLYFCRREARTDAAKEPLLSSFYHASILSHDSFARSLAFVLANRLADATLLATELFEIFHSVRDTTSSHAGAYW